MNTKAIKKGIRLQRILKVRSKKLVTFLKKFRSQNKIYKRSQKVLLKHLKPF